MRRKILISKYFCRIWLEENKIKINYQCQSYKIKKILSFQRTLNLILLTCHSRNKPKPLHKLTNKNIFKMQILTICSSGKHFL